MLQGGPSDEDALSKLLETYTTALQAGDVDTLIPLYSKGYEGPRGRNYEESIDGMRDFVPRFADWDVDMSTENAEVKVEGNTASVGPINFESERFAWSTTLLTEKEEDGCWRITGAEWERREE
jgi:ketosteroid isomerase-like protein